MYKFLFLLTCSFASFLFQKLPVYAHSSTHAKEILKRFTDAEKKSLSLFFQELIFNDNFAYTIFGTKPASLAGYFAWPQYMGPSALKQNHIMLYKGEQLCRQCNAFFLNKNFVFKIQSDPEVTWTIIYLINKKTFLETVTTNIALFKDILGDWVTPEDLLHSVL